MSGVTITVTVKQCNVLCDKKPSQLLLSSLIYTKPPVSDAVFIEVGDAGYRNKCCPVCSKIDRRLNPD